MKHSQLWFGLGLSIISASAACVDGEPTSEEVAISDEEIVGGANTTIDQVPWQIMVTTNGGFQFCGGSILNASWIATAQHCVTGGNADMRVVAGTTRVSTQASGQIRSIDAVTLAPGFTDPTVGDDVALLHLSTPLDLSGPNARAIPLVTPADAAAGATNPGVLATVTGWGTLRAGGPSPDILQTVNVPLISNAQANAAYNPEGITITPDQIGAAILGVGGVDSCQGDSGGPLTVSVGGVAKLAGVVSWGIGCALANLPGMYARVTSFDPYISQRANGRVLPLIALNGLTGARNTFVHRSVNVPAGTHALSVVLQGGAGDADLYVRRGSQPTTNRFDCRPFQNGNAEFCTINAPVAGTYFVSLRAFAAFSGASLRVISIAP
jgi:secreted trypsin-like serine protease